MIALIDQYRKELENIRIYAPDTVQVYTSCIQAFCEFAKEHLNVDPIKAKGTQLVLWLTFLKQTGISYSRLGHHQYALKSFFTFLAKMGVTTTNPAQSLPPIPRIRGRIKPISTEDAFKLLDPFIPSCSTLSWISASPKAPPVTTPQVEPLATIPPSSPVKAFSTRSSRLPIISWKTSREANAQLKFLMRKKGALRPQYPFFFLSIDFVMKSPPTLGNLDIIVKTSRVARGCYQPQAPKNRA